MVTVHSQSSIGQEMQSELKCRARKGGGMVLAGHGHRREVVGGDKSTKG